jgi:hypothetical protein
MSAELAYIMMEGVKGYWSMVVAWGRLHGQHHATPEGGSGFDLLSPTASNKGLPAVASHPQLGGSSTISRQEGEAGGQDQLHNHHESEDHHGGSSALLHPQLPFSFTTGPGGHAAHQEWIRRFSSPALLSEGGGEGEEEQQHYHHDHQRRHSQQHQHLPFMLRRGDQVSELLSELVRSSQE